MKRHGPAVWMAVIGAMMAWMLAGCASSKPVPQDVLLADQGYRELVQGNYQQAEANLNVALSINPNNPFALLNLGVVYQNTGRVEEAKKMYRKVIALDARQKASEATNGRYKGKSLVEIAKANLKMLER